MPRLVIKTPVYLRTPSNEAGYAGASAYMAQMSGASDDYIFRFPYAPVEVSFENMSSEYEEIRRPGDFAFITQKNPQLARVSFEFRIAHRPSNGLQPIHNELEILRSMAADDIPVTVVGLGDWFFNRSAQRLVVRSGQRAQTLFRIMEMGITVVRRLPGTNEPTQANCRVTLIEDRNPIFNVITLPPIVYEPEPPVATTNTRPSGNGGRTARKSSTPAPSQTNRKRTYTQVGKARSQDRPVSVVTPVRGVI